MAKRLLDVLELIQSSIRKGDLVQARSEVTSLCLRRRLPRSVLPQISHLARMAYLPEESLKLLSPYVHPARERPSTATPEEAAEYGMALASLGAGTEAIQLLSTQNLQQVPWAFFGLVTAMFRQWDWAAALPLIEEFVGRPGLSEADQLQANLCHGLALLHGRDDNQGARTILEGVLKKTKGRDYEWLHTEVLTVLPQTYFYEREPERALRALELLERSGALVSDSSLALRVEMIRVESQLMAAGTSSVQALREVRDLRKRLEDSRLWNRVRDLDYSEFYRSRDDKLLWHLYFGTSFPRAKEKFLRVAGLGPEAVPASFDWQVPGAVADETAPTCSLHLMTGENDIHPKARLKEGQIIQRTLHALVMDLYAPAESLVLFERIYPLEHFVPGTSMLKVRQALWQLRQWLVKYGIPLQVLEADSTYQLHATRPICLRIPSSTIVEAGGAPARSGEIRLRSLALRALEQFERGWFSAFQFGEKMALSERSAQRYLKQGVDRLRFESQGAGAARRYRVIFTG